MFFIHGLYVTYLRSLAIVGYLTTGRTCVHENGESERVYVIRNALKMLEREMSLFQTIDTPASESKSIYPKNKSLLG